MPHRLRVLTAAAVLAVLAVPAAASAASPGSTPTGVSGPTGSTAPIESKIVDAPKESVGCGQGGIVLTQAGPAMRWTIAPLGPSEGQTLGLPPVDPPSKDGEPADESEHQDQLREQQEMMRRLMDMLNQFNRTREDTVRGIG